MSVAERDSQTWRLQAERICEFMEREGWVAKYPFLFVGRAFNPIGMATPDCAGSQPINDNSRKPRAV